MSDYQTGPADSPEGRRPAGTRRPGPNRRRWLVAGLLAAVLAATATGLLWAHGRYNGQWLAQRAARLLSDTLLGRFEIGNVQWHLRALADLAFGTATPLDLTDVVIRDPSGATVISARKLHARLRLWPLIARQQVVFSEARLSGGYCLVGDMPREHGGHSIGIAATFMLAAPPSRGPDERGKSKGAPLIAIPRISLRDTRFQLDIGPTQFDLPGISLDGWLRIQGSVSKVGMQIGASVKAPEGWYVQNGVRVRLRRIRSPSVRIDGHTLRVKDFRGRFAGAPVGVDGELQRLFDDVKIDARAQIYRGAAALSRVFGLSVTGTANVIAEVKGPVGKPRAQARVRDLDLRVGGVDLRQVQGLVTMDVATLKLDISDARALTMDGMASGDGQLDADTGRWQAKLDLQRIDPGHFVRELAGELGGSVSLSGHLGPAKTGLAVVALDLRRRGDGPRDPIPRRLSIRGSAHLSPPIVDLAGITLSDGANSIHARGSINIPDVRSNLYLTLRLPALGDWFARRVGSPLIRSATGTVHMSGAYPRLRLSGEVEAHEVGLGASASRISRIKARLSFQNGSLRLTRLAGQGLGGRVRGEAALDLFRGDVTRPLPRPLLRASLRVEDMDLTAMGLGRYARGRVFADVDVGGPLDELTGTAAIRAPRLALWADQYVGVRARVGLLPDRISLYDVRLPRAKGGYLRLWGDVFHDQRIALQLQPKAFPIQAIPGAEDLPVGGLLSGSVRATGRLKDPRFEGSVDLKKVVIRGARLGACHVVLTPSEDTSRIKGRLLDGLASIEGFMLTRPRPSLHLSMDFKRFPLHEVVPEVRSLEVGEVNGFASGNVTVDADTVRGVTWANARLTELAFSLQHQRVGRRQPRLVRLVNQDDLLVTYGGGRLHVVTAQMVSTVPGHEGTRAEFSVGGIVAPGSSELTIRGNVPLQLAEFFLARRVRRISGVATADVTLRGPMDQLFATGLVELRGLEVWMPRFDRALKVPAGRLELQRGLMRLSDLRFSVGRQQVRAWGDVRMDPRALLSPATLQLRLEGDLHMGLLQLAFPEQLSSAGGAVRVRLSLDGPVGDPRMSGELAVRQVELAPRGVGHVLTLNSGKVAFSDYLVCLGGEIGCGGAGRCQASASSCSRTAPLKGTFDEGTVELYGEARFDQSELVDLYLRFRGASLPQRQPNVYAAEFNADLTLVGDQQSLALQGDIDLVDGRYVREFEILRDLVVRPRTYEEVEPFWQGTPVLQNLALSLGVRSTGPIKVKNRYADLGLAAALSVGGTLAEPRLQGTVRVEEGTFRIPFISGDYKVERGVIAFSRSRPPEQADLDILAETNFVDRGGTDYQIGLQLRGALDRINIGLTSQPHLDKGQILALLATGRTTEQWRAEMNAPETQMGSPTSAADESVKELTGNVLGVFLEDPLKKAMGLDLVRLEIGTETVTAKGCKNIGEAVEVCGEGEKDLFGGFGGKATANYKMHDYLRLMGRLERLSTRIEREQENPSRGRLELKFRLPLR